MELNGFLGVFYKIGEWVIRFIYVNVLWILFTLLGLVILGFMPSTVALFTIMRKWMNSEDFPVFNTYLTSFKEAFKKMNIVGLVLGIFIFILYLDYQIILIGTGTIFQIIAIVFIVILFIFALMLLYLFPVLAQYDLKVFAYFKYSLLFAFVSPLATISMLVGLLFTGYLMSIVPGLIPLFAVSSLAFILMAAARMAFSKATKLGSKKKKQNKLNVKDAE